jgi:hypothetical protein
VFHYKTPIVKKEEFLAEKPPSGGKGYFIMNTPKPPLGRMGYFRHKAPIGWKEAS